MLVLTGVFCFGVKEAQSFPGALFFKRVTESHAASSVILVNCNASCAPGRNCQTCVVEISGHYLHTTLRGLKVFEVEKLSYKSSCCSHVVTDSLNNSAPLHWIKGTVTSISQCFKLKSGYTVFIALQPNQDLNHRSDHQDTKILLLGPAVQCSPHLSVGDSVEVYNSTRFRWKASLDAPVGDAGENFCEPSEVFYFVDQPSSVRIVTGSNTSSAAVVLPSKFTAAQLLTPRTLLQKELLSNTEFAQITGTVRLVHTMGWIELTDVVVHEHNAAPNVDNNTGGASTDSAVGKQLVSCIVYLSATCVHHLRFTALGVSVRQCAVITVTNVIPTYLWGRLKGLATSCRSAFHIAKLADNKSFHSENPSYCAVNVSIPPEIKNCCVLYAVWRAEISRKLKQCIGGEAEQKRVALCKLITQHIESLSTHVSSGNHASLTVTTTNRGSPVADIMQLAPCNVQDVLYNLQYILLYNIRNGLDADWLGNNLPQLWSVSSLLSKLARMHRTMQPTVSQTLFGLYDYDTCAVSQGQSFWTQYNAQYNQVVRKNIVVVGTVKRALLPQLHCTTQENQHDEVVCESTSGPAGRLVELVVQDAAGEVISVLVHHIDAQWLAAAEELCKAHLSNTCGSCASNSSSAAKRRYCSCDQAHRQESGSSSSNSSSARNNMRTSGAQHPLSVTIHNPQCLLEQPPELDTGTTDSTAASILRPRPYMLSAASDVCFIADPALVPVPSNAADATPAAVQTSSEARNGAAGSTAVHSSDAQSQHSVGVRQLLCSDLRNYQNKYVASVAAVVTSKQLLQVEFKNERRQPQHDTKRRKLEAQQSLYEDTQQGFIARNEVSLADRKCCLTLRDVRYPDSINLFLPYRTVQSVTVGAVIEVYHVYVCLPEDKKKLYLKGVEGKKTAIELTGVVSGLQLQRLGELSRFVPDPRFIDVVYQGSTTQCNFRYRPPGSSGTPAIPGCGQEQGYLEPPPATNIRKLTALSSHNRATWRLTGQVVYVRKVTVSLRCTRCQCSAKKYTQLGGFQCPRCASVYTLRPLWEAVVAFDDGTGECLMHIEGEEVFLLIRARFDSRSIALRDVRACVDKYVERHGSLVYEAFAAFGGGANTAAADHNDTTHGAVGGAYKPYSALVAEEQARARSSASNLHPAASAINGAHGPAPSSAHAAENQVATSSTTAAAPVQPNVGDSIFNIPLSEHRNMLLSHIDLKASHSDVKVVAILKAYMQLGSYSHHYVVYCKIDYSAASLKAAQSKFAMREAKLQQNNAAAPYMAYFVLRPTRADAKLTVQVLNSRELHGERMTSAAWDLVAKLKGGK